MIKKIYLTSTVFIAMTMSLSCPVSAQNMDDGSGARIEKLERDLMLLQRQLSRSSSGSAGSAPSGGGGVDLEVRLSGMEEQMRTLLGKAEENEFKVRKLSESLDKLQRDTDFRFGELGNASGASAQDNSQLQAPAQRKVPDENLKAELDRNGRSLGKVVDTAGKPAQNPQEDEESATEEEFATSRDHYNYAFRLLNQTQYDKAAETFATFIKKHPKDPLIGNAYYWQGETYYIRRDYIKAADSFRQGFEELPNGPKAPDNLLKLAMTLNSLKRDKEACVVLGQVVAKFKNGSAAVAQKAEQEQKRIDCK
ncbi:MAG: tol-pal system protein YbgF [Pseudomonadota bacterium]